MVRSWPTGVLLPGARVGTSDYDGQLQQVSQQLLQVKLSDRKNVLMKSIVLYVILSILHPCQIYHRLSKSFICYICCCFCVNCYTWFIFTGTPLSSPQSVRGQASLGGLQSLPLWATWPIRRENQWMRQSRPVREHPLAINHTRNIRANMFTYLRRLDGQ